MSEYYCYFFVSPVKIDARTAALFSSMGFTVTLGVVEDMGGD